MPSPFIGSAGVRVAPSGDALVDALSGVYRWAPPLLTYSFPGLQATWSTHSATGYGARGGGGEPWSASYQPLTATQRADFATALQSWAAVAAIGFMEVVESAAQVGDIRAAWTAWHGEGPAAAWAYYPGATAAAIAGDIWFNALDASARKPWTPGSYQHLTLLHELGHGLGLKHPFEGPAQLPSAWDAQGHTVMSYSALPGQPRSEFSFYPTTPMVLDVAAIQHLYGANRTWHAGDDVYVFDDQRARHETVWDAGGTDTLRYDGAGDALIDLREGEGSMLGVPVFGRAAGQAPLQVRNVWIARGAEVENATGSIGDDRLVGNAADNRLMGRGGDDRIEGGGGIDTAVYEGRAEAYTVHAFAQGFVVDGPDGTDTLIGVERLQIGDAHVALDLDGAAGQAWRLYRAAFARAPDVRGLGEHVAALEQGATLAEVAARFIASPEFDTLYPSDLADRDFVAALYRNVLQRAHDDDGLVHHLHALAGGAGRHDVLACFAESPENQAALVGVAHA